MEDENVLAEDSNTAEEVADLDTVTEQSDSTESEESVDDVKAQLEKERELANNYKIRAEKAEKAAKVRVETKVETNPGISSKDTIALINAKVHEEDVDDVIDYAKYKKISIGDALKSTVIKASLKEKNELRDTANATNTGRTRSGSSKVSVDSMLDKARKTGELPESDDAINAILDARYKR